MWEVREHFLYCATVCVVVHFQSWYFPCHIILAITLNYHYIRIYLILKVNRACDSLVIFSPPPPQESRSRVHRINKSATRGCVFRFFRVVFCLCALHVGRGRMRSHPSPANSHQSGPMLEPQREEAIAHSTGAHSPSTQGGQGHLTHQGPVYFSLLSGATLYVCVCVSVCVYNSVCFCRRMCLCVC